MNKVELVKIVKFVKMVELDQHLWNSTLISTLQLWSKSHAIL